VGSQACRQCDRQAPRAPDRSCGTGEPRRDERILTQPARRVGLDEGSEEHAALERLVGEPLGSDSAELRALVLLGVERVRETLLEDAYNTAVDAGDFDETREWVAQTSAARRRRRAPA
jgi:hypothetical protein